MREVTRRSLFAATVAAVAAVLGWKPEPKWEPLVVKLSLDTSKFEVDDVFPAHCNCQCELVRQWERA